MEQSSYANQVHNWAWWIQVSNQEVGYYIRMFLSDYNYYTITYW